MTDKELERELIRLADNEVEWDDEREPEPLGTLYPVRCPQCNYVVAWTHNSPVTAWVICDECRAKRSTR